MPTPRIIHAAGNSAYPQITGDLDDSESLYRAVLLLAHFTRWSAAELMGLPTEEFDAYCEAYNRIVREMCDDEQS